MIKVEKSLDEKDIPKVLDNQYTQNKRNLLIENGAWENTKENKSPFQSNQVRNKLMKIYNEKCAFCEQKLKKPKKNTNKQSHNALSIDHYRPKSKYWWLSYSWDNLLPVCNDCNNAKDNDFETKNIKIENIRVGELEQIHLLTEQYNTEEKPLFIHPELEDLSVKFEYTTKGNISSKDKRCTYVIQTCQLDRPKLILERRKAYDKIKAKFKAELLGATDPKSIEAAITKIAKSLALDIKRPKTTFIAYRTYMLQNFAKFFL